MSRIMACATNMAERKQMDFGFGAGPFPALQIASMVAELITTSLFGEMSRSLMCLFFDPFPLFGRRNGCSSVIVFRHSVLPLL